jgi:TfoX/Sxy family transcriptional regulator of competence genes
MATDRDFMEFVVDQMRGAGAVSYRKMFGEYAVYCDGKWCPGVRQHPLCQGYGEGP